MKKWMKIIVGLAAIGMLAALYIWFFVYNKPHRDYEKATPDHIIGAKALFDQYRQDKSLADSLYTGSVVQINGALSKIETADTLMIVVFAFEQGMFGDEGIRCIMLQNQNNELQGFASQDMITIKGYCTGYNDTDVIIEKASILETE